jgi:hypothetical protein
MFDKSQKKKKDNNHFCNFQNYFKQIKQQLAQKIKKDKLKKNIIV